MFFSIGEEIIAIVVLGMLVEVLFELFELVNILLFVLPFLSIGEVVQIMK